MSATVRRIGHWPFALLLAGVAACADQEPTASPRLSNGYRQALDGNVIVVTNTSGANIPGSLAWAVSIAGGGSVIQFDPALAGATIAVDATLDAFADIVVEGPTTRGITLTSNAGRIFRLRQGGVLRNLTLTGGSDGPGSAVWTQGPLRVEQSTVTGNDGNAGAIHGFDITLVNSTVSGNTGASYASGISLGSSGVLTLINSTVAHNEPAPGIGWMTAPGAAPIVTLRNAIVANNGTGSRNCGDALVFVYQGMNISSDWTCGVSPALYVGDPLLRGLAPNGGPTATEAFDYRSPALDAAINCDVTVDQRYVARSPLCDVGAFEFTDYTVVTLAIDANATIGAPNGTAVVSGTVRCSRAGDQFGVVVDLQQEQKAGKTTTIVHGTGGVGVTCSTTTQSWSAVVTPTAGAFVAGSGSATAQTNDAPRWVAPASATRTVKIVRPRK